MTTIEKTCFKCSKRLTLADFYRHPRMADGHLNKCKACTKADVRKNRSDNHEYYRDYERDRATLDHRVQARREYAKTDAGKAAHASACRRQRELRPDRRAARVALGNALRDGRVVKPCACWACGRIPVHGHHFDYAQPLLVSWLCQVCHKETHRITDQALAGLAA